MLTATPSWLPPERSGVQVLPCGRWFDAVRVPSFDGVRAIGRLGSRSGPVIEDQVAMELYWLVPVGSAVGWALPGVEILGTGRSLAVPPAAWVDGPARRWLLPPRGGRLTDPGRLHEALAEAVRRA